MTVASQLITDALQLMGAASEISPADPAQEAKGFDVLQAMIEEWKEDDIDIVAVSPYDITDDIGESLSMKESITALLCDRLAGYLQIELTERVELMVDRARDRLLNYAPNPDIKYQKTLPIGQGNKVLGNYRNSPYFDTASGTDADYG